MPPIVLFVFSWAVALPLILGNIQMTPLILAMNYQMIYSKSVDSYTSFLRCFFVVSYFYGAIGSCLTFQRKLDKSTA